MTRPVYYYRGIKILINSGTGDRTNYIFFMSAGVRESSCYYPDSNGCNTVRSMTLVHAYMTYNIYYIIHYLLYTYSGAIRSSHLYMSYDIKIINMLEIAKVLFYEPFNVFFGIRSCSTTIIIYVFSVMNKPNTNTQKTAQLIWK